MERKAERKIRESISLFCGTTKINGETLDVYTQKGNHFALCRGENFLKHISQKAMKKYGIFVEREIRLGNSDKKIITTFQAYGPMGHVY